MKKNYFQNAVEKGQVIPMVIVMFLVILGMVALITDGGAVMFNRRTAQAAADAGALAGAQRVCLGYNDAKTVAENYAIAKNGATSAVATVVGKQVTVNATVQYPSFFAGIFGDPTLDASAEATAGCFGVKGKSVVPVAWYCNPNNDPTAPFNTEYGCQMQTLSWELIEPLVTGEVGSIPIPNFGGVVKHYQMSGTSLVSIEDGVQNKIPAEQIYIIFDGDKICSEDIHGDNACDIIGDKKLEILSGGNRGYVYLDTIINSIPQYLDDPNISMKSHSWLGGHPGGIRAVEVKMEPDFNGMVVMIPVYNYLCDTDPQTQPSQACMTSAHTDPRPPLPDDGDDFSNMKKNKKYYFHVVAFSPFYVSCVSKSGNCPGYKLAQTQDSTLKSNEGIIEGYFISDYNVSLDPTQDCSINLGNCSVSLSK